MWAGNGCSFLEGSSSSHSCIGHGSKANEFFNIFSRHWLCKGLSTLAWHKPTWILQMSVPATGVADTWWFSGRAASKSKPCVRWHETDTGSTKVVLEEGEQVYVKWPPDITIIKFGAPGTPDCWNNLKAEADAQGVNLILRTIDRRPKSGQQLTVPAGARYI